MSAHTVPATVSAFCNLPGAMKMAILDLTLSASYDAGGSVADFSTTGSLGVALGFRTVHTAFQAGQSTAADSKYYPVFIPAAANAAATCLVKVHDTSAAADAEASGDLHTHVIRMCVIGT